MLALNCNKMEVPLLLPETDNHQIHIKDCFEFEMNFLRVLSI